jgi:hypothetical protein
MNGCILEHLPGARLAKAFLDLDELASLPGPEWGGFPPGARLGQQRR